MAIPLKILLIEDSAEIREALTQSIEASGSMVVVGVADNSADAILIIDSTAIDAVIIDLHLREGSGFLVLAHLTRKKEPRMLRIVLTNHTTAPFRRSCERLGVDHFLDKSLEFDHAIELLEQYAGARGLSSTAF